MSQKVARGNGHAANRKSLPPHARPSKPPPLRRGHSYNHAYTHSRSASHSRPGSSGTKKAQPEVEVQYIEEEESGMASFLQFCATCEKQIITPGVSILYCSEACRRKDVSRPASIQSLESVKSPSAMQSAISYFESHPPADIIPQRSPTVLRPMSLTFSDLSIDDTESSHSTYNSEASSVIRPRLSRAQTSDISTIPSLIHSPSSSYGTIASNASYRPLPPRHNPFTTSFSTKSIDIVIPCSPPRSPKSLLKDASLKSSASTLTSLHVAEPGHISYEKRSPISPGGSSDRTTLQQLFCHDAMKAPPRSS